MSLPWRAVLFLYSGGLLENHFNGLEATVAVAEQMEGVDGVARHVLLALLDGQSEVGVIRQRGFRGAGGEEFVGDARVDIDGFVDVDGWRLLPKVQPVSSSVARQSAMRRVMWELQIASYRF